ncbi:MAG TPA: hypothetical protein VN765_06770 [Candidatus Acidoferrum sp.]|nr:hypothetical protein [Candidatus Acidoferrum sp.]
MNPKILLGLALVLISILPGCSTHNRDSGAAVGSKRESDSNGLACRVSVPSLKLQQDGTIPALLILTNQGSKPFRICALGNPVRGVGPGDRFDVCVMSGLFFSDGPLPKELYKGVTTLEPGGSLPWPFAIIAGTNTTLRISAHFSSETNFLPEDLNCWHGEIDAKPLTIKVER